MEEKIVLVLNEMSEYLTIPQMKKLQEVIIKNFAENEVEKGSFERIHPHKFRRSMATRAIDKGMPIEQVQIILGHSQIDTTMQYAMVNQTNVKTSHQSLLSLFM